MSFPLSQKAVVLETTGKPGQLQVKTDYRIPILEHGELLIKNTLCGVNTVDTYYRNGFFEVPLPAILGQEAVGTVAALGPGTSLCNFKIGDRVIWIHKRGYAEYSAVPLANIIKLPKGVSDQDALGGFLSGLTALTLFRETAVVKKGDWILLHAATTNVGLLMTQILKSVGVKVIATVDHSEKIGHAKSVAADAVIDYKDNKDKNWVQKVKEITKGAGVSVVYDCIGKDTWKGSLEAVKTNGTVVWCGSLSGSVPPICPELLSPKCVKVIYATPTAYVQSREKLDRYTNELLGHFKSGRLRVNIHNIYFLEDVAQAHTDLEKGKTFGKILLRP